MERKKVNASNMRSIGYDSKEQILEIEFSNGGVYQYSRVPQEVYRRLCAAPSPRSYFEDNIQESYSNKRIR
jgi:KTSC domain